MLALSGTLRRSDCSLAQILELSHGCHSVMGTRGNLHAHVATQTAVAKLLWRCGTICGHEGVSVAIDRHSTTELHRHVII